MASPAIRVSQYEEAKKDQDEDDDLDKELESYIAESDKKKQEDTNEEKVKDNDSTSSEGSGSSSDTGDKTSSKDNQEPKESDTDKTKPEVTEQKDTADDTAKDQTDKVDSKEVNKDEKENVSNSGKERQKSPEEEDSEPDEYTLTEDQQRALREMEELRREMGLPEEDPPEYDVRERLKSLNEELANDPTPVEKHTSKVGFKDNLVDLVAPPPDYPDEETPRNQENSGGSSDSFSAKSQDTDKVEDDDIVNDNDEDKKVSENVKSDDSNDKMKRSDEKVLIEKDGKFELVSSDDVRAKDLGLPILDEENTNNNSDNMNNSASNSQEDFNRKPTPPSHPRPSTANGNARRNVRVSSSRQRASSAGPHRGSALDEDFNYNSPYAMSSQDKELLKKQKKYKEEQMKEKEKQERRDREEKERENNDAFQYWLKQKREEMREKRKREEEERKRNGPHDRRKHGSDDSLVTGSYHSDSDQTNSLEAYDQLYYETDQNKEAYQSWLKVKVDQNKKEKLLKRRQEMEATDGFYIRTREECDKAFRQWLRQKNTEARKARMVERQRAKIHRLAARRARKSSALSKAIVQSNAFRYVDYYGYRY